MSREKQERYLNIDIEIKIYKKTEIKVFGYPETDRKIREMKSGEERKDV